MTFKELDFIFPFVVFGYGLITTFVLNTPYLLQIGRNKLPSNLLAQFEGHRVIALVCLFIGGFWSLQNIWLQNV